MQPRIKNKSELPVGEQTIPDQSTQSFTVVIDQYSQSLLFVNNNNGEVEGGLKERRGSYFLSSPAKGGL